MQVNRKRLYAKGKGPMSAETFTDALAREYPELAAHAAATAGVVESASKQIQKQAVHLCEVNEEFDTQKYQQRVPRGKRCGNCLKGEGREHLSNCNPEKRHFIPFVSKAKVAA